MKQIIIVLSLFLSLSAEAQSWQLFYRLIEGGNYSEAKHILKVLENVDHETMTRVDACIKLQKEAEALYRKEYYTKAIEKYRQIQKYFPNDETVEPSIKQCEIARGEYNRKLEQIQREEQERQARIEEDTFWNNAVMHNTINEYMNYLDRYPYGRYRALARWRVYGLYVSNAQKCYNAGDYAGAINNYDNASKYDTLTSAANQLYRMAQEKLVREQEENAYELLQKGDVVVFQLEAFLESYPNSEHCPTVRGQLVKKYCALHKFYDARELVAKFPESIAFSPGIIQNSKWWMKYIGQQERNFSKALRKHPDNIQRKLKQSSLSMFDDVGIMLSFGGTISFAKNPPGAAYVGPRLAFSIGDIYNNFNLEVSMSGIFQRPDNAFEIQLPLAIGPRWNIIANDFVIYIQPEIGYDILHKGLYYAGRTGFGGDWGSIYVGVAYNREAVDLAQIQVGCIWSWMWDL